MLRSNAVADGQTTVFAPSPITGITSTAQARWQRTHFPQLKTSTRTKTCQTNLSTTPTTTTTPVGSAGASLWWDWRSASSPGFRLSQSCLSKIRSSCSTPPSGRCTPSASCSQLPASPCQLPPLPRAEATSETQDILQTSARKPWRLPGCRSFWFCSTFPSLLVQFQSTTIR